MITIHNIEAIEGMWLSANYEITSVDEFEDHYEIQLKGKSPPHFENVIIKRHMEDNGGWTMIIPNRKIKEYLFPTSVLKEKTKFIALMSKLFE